MSDSFRYILNNISYAPHILLLTVEVNGSHLLDFHFNLFGIACTIPSSNANDSVAFQSFTISWNLNMGFKTKVITLTHKRRTITSNEEEEMIKLTEIHNSNNISFSRLKKYIFCKKLCFG